MIHEPAKQRVVEGGTTGPGLLALFEQMIEEAKHDDLDSVQLMVSYFDDGDEFVEGTFVPELHLVVRKVL